MTKSTYNLCLLYRFGSLEIVGVQTDNTLISVDNNFASMNEKAVKNAKIMTKD